MYKNCHCKKIRIETLLTDLWDDEEASDTMLSNFDDVFPLSGHEELWLTEVLHETRMCQMRWSCQFFIFFLSDERYVHLILDAFGITLTRECLRNPPHSFDPRMNPKPSSMFASLQPLCRALWVVVYVTPSKQRHLLIHFLPFTVNHLHSWIFSYALFCKPCLVLDFIDGCFWYKHLSE